MNIDMKIARTNYKLKQRQVFKDNSMEISSRNTMDQIFIKHNTKYLMGINHQMTTKGLWGEHARDLAKGCANREKWDYHKML